MRVSIFRGQIAAFAAVLLTACATKAPPPQGQADPDRAVAGLHAAWMSAPAETLYAGAPTGRGTQTRSRAFIRRQAQNLSFRHPRHVPTRWLLAVMAYEAKDPIDATRHLDTLLRLQPVHPEAVMLRTRIDLEEGNASHATRLLTSQVRVRPDHAGLRESLASAYFMSGDHKRALQALDSAETLGGAADRIAYNRGLIAEDQGNVEQARTFYEQALALSPNWRQPRARLDGLAGSPVQMNTPEAFAPPPPPLPQPPIPATALR